MRILLETHALYWFIEGDSQLSQVALTTVRNPANEVLISPASFWEIAIKVSLCKWQVNRPYEDFIDMGLNHYGFKVLPILPKHTARLIGLPFHHKDPFDRLLVAQSLVESIPVVPGCCSECLWHQSPLGRNHEQPLSGPNRTKPSYPVGIMKTLMPIGHEDGRPGLFVLDQPEGLTQWLDYLPNPLLRTVPNGPE